MDLVNAARGVADRAFNRLIACGLAMNAHKAHGNAANGYRWRALQQQVLGCATLK
jgi:hypothetical protein